MDLFNQIIIDLQNVEVEVDDEDQALLLLCSLPESYENLVDTMSYGCSYHMYLNRELFTMYEKIRGGKVLMGNNNACRVIGIATVWVKMFDRKTRTSYNVRHVPRLKKSLTRLGTLDSLGYKYKGKCGVLKVSRGAFVVINGLYILKVRVYFIKYKSGVFLKFKCWKALVERQTKKPVKLLRTDNGLEFYSDEFNKFCGEQEIVRHRPVLGTPQQNSVADWMNMTILERTRSMLLCVGLGNEFSAEACNTTAYLINRSPSTVIECVTPNEKWTGSSINYTDLKVFGYPTYAHVRKGKLDSRAKKCIFIGYVDGSYGQANLVAYALSVAEEIEGDDSLSYMEAIQNRDWVQRGVAMIEEMESFRKNQMWKLVKPPKNQKIMECKWVYRKNEGIMRLETSRVQLALVALYDLELEQLNVKITFLHEELEKRIYMKQPDKLVPGKEDHVYLLKKSLYELKQSLRQWYKKFYSFMCNNGFSINKYDFCVHVKKLQDGSYIYLLLYVDDMLIAAKNRDEINMLKSRLNVEFEMKDLGAAKKDTWHGDMHGHSCGDIIPIS
ncbi:hypothetical protein CRG98_031555 [Punica granatum]|uniref:Integrase catalytic domain-containing protein n=1 Tax=Punica granatum TaxID=22663 RepID=A0A2I0IVK3_PUNGR|nr:hypothetical protein CRG98_031555 [Punica granatum]